MSNVVNTQQSFPIVDSEGKANSEFYLLMQQLVGLAVTEHSGNPDGVLEGNVNQLCRDTTGGPPVLYINTDGGTTWTGV